MRGIAGLFFLLSMPLPAGCGSKGEVAFASGAFEAVEILVSAEAGGRIMALAVEEGEVLVAGQEVGHLDCRPLRPDNVDLQLKRCRITAPSAGTVLVKYAQAGEITSPGKPLFKMADTSVMTLRAYVTSDQLSAVKLGDAVPVTADFDAGGTRSYQGKIVWISTKSEFTPKTIQTRDERANLVYAMKVAVPNDGYLKIGMYGTIAAPSHE